MNPIARAARASALGLIWLYRHLLSPLLPPACRFYPTCSEYAAEAFQQKSPARAAWLTVRRLARCGPWSAGGFDPVPDDHQGGAIDEARADAGHGHPHTVQGN